MLTERISTEDVIVSIVKPHTDFNNTINQHEIAAEYMFIRNEHMAGRRVRKIITTLAKDKDYQIWIEKVDSSGSIGFYIEDRKVKYDNNDVPF